MTWCQVWRVRSLANEWHVVFGQKRLDHMGGMNGCIVVVKPKIVCCPHLLLLFFAQLHQGDVELPNSILCWLSGLLVHIRDAQCCSNKKKHVMNTFTSLRTCCAFWGLGDSTCFHYEHWNLVSELQPNTHISSPVMIVFINSGSCYAQFRMSWATCFCCSVSSLKWNKLNPCLFPHLQRFLVLLNNDLPVPIGEPSQSPPCFGLWMASLSVGRSPLAFGHV